MKPYSERKINRRDALLFSATAGLGIALSDEAKGLDSTKTAAHQGLAIARLRELRLP
jgi:hypothetical protein